MNPKVFEELVEAATLGVKMLEMCGEAKEADNISGAIQAAEAELKKQGEVKVFEGVVFTKHKDMVRTTEDFEYFYQNLPIEKPVRITVEKLEGK